MNADSCHHRNGAYPHYGIAPADPERDPHMYGLEAPKLPRKQWSDFHFTEDPALSGWGIYACPDCGETEL